mgnify:CR=1 FL=1
MRDVFWRNYRITYVVNRGDEEVEVLTLFHSLQQSGALGPDDE